MTRRHGAGRVPTSVLGLGIEARRTLLTLARQSVVAATSGKPLPDTRHVSPPLDTPAGVFVTLRAAHDLRGCVGLIKGLKPLAEGVVQMARSAALDDPRFAAVTPHEVDLLSIEISVLSPLEELGPDRLQTIEVGVHGLYIVKGGAAGLLLPQVAVEHGWDPPEFLRQTCLKAGLPPDAHRTGSKVYAFQAEVFGEEELDPSEPGAT